MAVSLQCLTLVSLLILFTHIANAHEIYFRKSNAVVSADVSTHWNVTSSRRRVARGLPNKSQRKLYLDLHNKYRRDAGASNMREVVWDDSLAEMALGWAKKCSWEHGQPENTSPYKQLGQNLYVATHELDIDDAVFQWHDEIKDYDFDSNACSAVCGHYTQVVWDDTDVIGCAHYLCDVVEGIDPPLKDGQYVVCNYGPAGNYPRKPFSKGDACTECSTDSFWCNDGLCASELEDKTSAKCAAECLNCGSVKEEDCTCACEKGYIGGRCENECEDTDKNCGANPGWPTRWCGDSKRAFVDKKCPLMCGKCEVREEPLDCPDPTKSKDEVGNVKSSDEKTESAARPVTVDVSRVLLLVSVAFLIQ